jgi:hypothetical protein
MRMGALYRDTMCSVMRWLPILVLLTACDPEPVLTAVEPPPTEAVEAVAQRRAAQEARVTPDAVDAGAAYRKPPGVYVDVPHLAGRSFEAAREDVQEQLGALKAQGPAPDGALEFTFERGKVRVVAGSIQMVEVVLPEPLRRSEALAVLGFAPVADTWRNFANEFRVANVQGFRRIRMVRTQRGAEEIARVECWKYTNQDR